jgi:hypothetical protein
LINTGSLRRELLTVEDALWTQAQPRELPVKRAASDSQQRGRFGHGLGSGDGVDQPTARRAWLGSVWGGLLVPLLISARCGHKLI